MTIPRYDEFFVPMLRILSDGKIHASGEMLTLLADDLVLIFFLYLFVSVCSDRRRTQPSAT